MLEVLDPFLLEQRRTGPTVLVVTFHDRPDDAANLVLILERDGGVDIFDLLIERRNKVQFLLGRLQAVQLLDWSEIDQIP